MLLGVDAQRDVASFVARSVSLSSLVEMVGDHRVMLVLDTCYAGKGRGGEDLVEGTRFAVPSYALRHGDQVIEWTAAGPNELSGPLHAVSHGAFTYLAIGAMRGWADGEVDGVRDGQVTATEAQRYVDRSLRVLQIREQTPQLVFGGDADALMLSRKATERGPDLATLAGTESPVSAGRAEVGLGGDAVDFAALAAQAEAARRAKEEADRQAAEAQTRLEAERGRRLAAAATEVRASAKRDFDANSTLVTDPTPEGRPVLEAWLARYGKVTVDGVTEMESMAEVARVEAALVRAVEAVPAPATAMASVSSHRPSVFSPRTMAFF